MTRLGNISGKDTVKAFQKAGWQPIGQVGSHLVMIKPGVRVNLSIPQHRELSVGTLRSLIRNAGMTVEEFLGLLD
jgi:predicted RNA binding protein YcfA (HicA-like mRNA interferase family)